jgi:hypothetical protein
MTRRAWDRALGLLFALVGAAVVIEGFRLPSGTSGVPGPGVFPIGIGFVLAALGVALVLSARDGEPYFHRGWSDTALRRTALAVGLLTAYIATWHVAPFAWRTPLLLVALYRLFGEGWLRSLVLGGLITGAMVIVFQVLFGVRF